MKFFIFRLVYLIRLINPAGRTFFRAIVEDRDDFQNTLNSLVAEKAQAEFESARVRPFRLAHLPSPGFERILQKEEIPGAADIFAKQECVPAFRLADVQTTATSYRNDDFI